MKSIPQITDAHAPHSSTHYAPAQAPLRSKRRPKLSARYLSYVHKTDNDMPDYDPSSDDAAVSHLKKPLRSFALLNNIHDNECLPNQPSDVQTTAPSSPYDADEEDEGERDIDVAPNSRKRRRRSSSHPPAKHSRRASGRRMSRTDPFDRVADLETQQSSEKSHLKHLEETLPTSPKRSPLTWSKHPDETTTVFHTEPNLPGIKLWDHHNKALVPGKFLPSQLGTALGRNKHYAIYLGQDEAYIKYPADVVGLATPANQELWMNELRKPPVQRRVMIIDPISARLQAPRKCPTLDELTTFLEELEKERSKAVRRRIFNAHYTDSHGFTHQRWQSLFAIPPPMPGKSASNTAPNIHPLIPSRPPRRTMRQMKSVRYTEAPSDPAEFQSSESDISIEAPQASNKTASRGPPRLSFILSSPSASDPEASNSHADRNVDVKQQSGIYQDIFPASSSEYERAEVRDLLSHNPSSDESDEAKNFDVRSSVEQNIIDNKNVSSSVLVLNRTRAIRLQNLYSFHESSASDDSISEALDGSCLGGACNLDTGVSSLPTKPSENKLRLQLSSVPESDAQTITNAPPPANGKGDNSLSLRFHVEKPSSRPNNNSAAPQDAQLIKMNQRSEDKAKCEHIPTVPRPRRVRQAPSAIQESVVLLPRATRCQRSKDVRIQHSNDASDRSMRNSIGKRKGIGNSTNENLDWNLATKKGERAEDEVKGRVPHACICSSSLARVVTTPNHEARCCNPLHLKEPAPLSIIRRRRCANANGSQSNNDQVRDDTKTSIAEEPSVPTTCAGGTNPVPKLPVAHLSEEVYLWDFAKKKRSDTLIPLASALKLCADNYLTTIYDGQDIRPGDLRFGKLWGEIKAWVSRKGTRPPLMRRVRVWDHCTGNIEKYRFSPTLYDVEQWLKDNPDNSLFRPSLYVQYEHKPPFKKAESTASSVQSRVKQVIQSQVLNRIKHLRVTQLYEGPQQGVILWNVLKRNCEPPRNFVRRSDLTRFLFSNPALELLCGQDELFRLESSTELKLIHITQECPAEYVCFWDTRSRDIILRTKERETSEKKTISQCLNDEPWLEVYTGQDRPEKERIRGMMLNSKNACSRSLYTLAQCGKLVETHVFSQGWVPKYIEPQKESASYMTFWSKSQKAFAMESLCTELLSVEEYLKSYPDLELYIGQDLEVEVQEQLHKWFQVLKYKPGTDVNKAAPVLLRYRLIPLKYRAVRFTSGLEFKHPREQRKPQRRRRQEASEAEPNADPSKRDKGTSGKRQRLNLRVTKRVEDEFNHHVSLSSFSDDEENLETGRTGETETTRARSQDTTNYDEENLDESSGPGCTRSPSSSTFDDDYSESGSEYDTGICTEGDASMHFPEHLPDVKDHIRNATKSAKKMICVIREAGPKVLKRELVHDIRQNLREQLILEVESVKHLMELAKNFSSCDFASVANELCEELQLLDVHGCFSCSQDLAYTPSDLSSIRKDLGTGRICTASGVIKKFREVCAGLIQFHDGTLLQGQAALLRFYGEELITEFQKSHMHHLQREQQMIRVFRICERAKHIGFRTGQRNRKSKHMSNSLLLGSSEPSLRVSGRQPEVTFLNYRDEKGNSVMGKRPSVRVFGFTIDTKALEEKIGHITPCHVCRKDVVLSQADSMRCSNHIFDICKEVVCRECLETIFSLEQGEFKVIRDSENWFCVHCRGLCPSGSECMETVSRGMATRTMRSHFRFIWPYAPCDSESIVTVISKRHRNGEHDPFPECIPEYKFDLVQDLSEKSRTWFASMDLEIGAYRCQVIVNNVWTASTSFHILPSPADSVSAYKPEKVRAVPKTSVSYLNGPHPFCANTSAKLAARTRPRGPRIRWHPIPKGSAYAIHAIRDSSSQDGGTLVKACSRTEGYDWRRAKRPATLQWVPETLCADVCQGVQQEDPKRIILCAMDSERAHLVAMENPPTPCTGVSHHDFLISLNTFRYNEMLKSLWSIVTGRSRIHGIGLFTLSGYKKGDFVIEYAGDLIRTPLADIREARYDAAGLGTYLFKINDEQIVDATVQSNRARFTNHSCDPNMVADIVHVQGRDLIVLRATREIPRFTELTFDYKFPYEEAKVQCLCNSWNCVGVMN